MVVETDPVGFAVGEEGPPGLLARGCRRGRAIEDEEARRRGGKPPRCGQEGGEDLGFREDEADVRCADGVGEFVRRVGRVCADG